MQVVNVSGEAAAPEAVDVGLHLTVATTPDQTTYLYVFLGGAAISELNTQLNKTGVAALSCNACVMRTAELAGLLECFLHLLMLED